VCRWTGLGHLRVEEPGRLKIVTVGEAATLLTEVGVSPVASGFVGHRFTL
jgi:hypothetical protein